MAAIYPHLDITSGERQAQPNSYDQMIGPYLSAGQLFEVLILSAGADEAWGKVSIRDNQPVAAVAAPLALQQQLQQQSYTTDLFRLQQHQSEFDWLQQQAVTLTQADLAAQAMHSQNRLQYFLSLSERMSSTAADSETLTDDQHLICNWPTCYWP